MEDENLVDLCQVEETNVGVSGVSMDCLETPLSEASLNYSQVLLEVTASTVANYQ